ncbi:MAG: hypothetical protein IPL82_09910 [Elusimicrobia bacterium]|nr:hypothetical protein [Elusimicrobiota bacterium]
MKRAVGYLDKDNNKIREEVMGDETTLKAEVRRETLEQVLELAHELPSSKSFYATSVEAETALKIKRMFVEAVEELMKEGGK